MSQFDNMNLKVQRYSTGIKTIGEYTNISEAALLRRSENNRIVTESAMVNQNNIDKKLSSQKELSRQSGIVNRQILENSRFSILNNMSLQAKEETFKQIVFEAFYHSLVLDSDFLVENYNNIKAFSDNYIDSHGGYSILEEACKRNKNNKLLKNVKNACTKSASRVVARKNEQMKESYEAEIINFELTEEEKDEIRYSADLGIDEVSEIVKDKVRKVLQSEQDRQSFEEELLSQLEEGVGVKESTIQYANIVEETTLFNGLMRKGAKMILQEKASCKEGMEEIDDEFDSDDIIEKLEEDEDLNLDIVLSEAITNYTLLEVMNTYMLEDFPLSKVRKMAHDTLYK